MNRKKHQVAICGRRTLIRGLAASPTAAFAPVCPLQNHAVVSSPGTATGRNAPCSGAGIHQWGSFHLFATSHPGLSRDLAFIDNILHFLPEQ